MADGTFADNTASCSARSGVTLFGFYRKLETNAFDWKAGNVYYVTFDYKSSKVGRIRFPIQGFEHYAGEVNKWITKSFTMTCPSNPGNSVYCYKYDNIEQGDTLEVKNAMIIDLTAMGLDSLTADQFRSLYPLNYYQYNSGELLSFNGSGIKTVGFNTSSTLELPISQYFPQGMRSAGSVYDELTSKKAITRVGSVDLGTLTWAYNANYGLFISYGIQGVAVPPATSAEKGNITSIYPTVAQDNNKQKGFSLWKTSALSYWNNGEFADVNAFLSAMNGVMLYYEMKTPTETDIDIDLTYTVEKGGTEQLLPINGSVPTTSPMSRNVSFFYDSNVVSNLLTLLSSVAQVETSPTTHSYAVNDYLIWNYQLYKVKSAIAVGGTLTVGTNITATTLIDVIKSL